MAQHRKTRQQKIQSNFRKSSQVAQQPATEIASEQAGNPGSKANTQDHLALDHAYVMEDILRIAWISAICLAIIAVCAVLLSDLPPFPALRSGLGLPTLL